MNPPEDPPLFCGELNKQESELYVNYLTACMPDRLYAFSQTHPSFTVIVHIGKYQKLSQKREWHHTIRVRITAPQHSARLFAQRVEVRSTSTS